MIVIENMRTVIYMHVSERKQKGARHDGHPYRVCTRSGLWSGGPDRCSLFCNMEEVERMKQQIILWMSRISVGIVAVILCVAISFAFAFIFDDSFRSDNKTTEVAYIVSCVMFAIAFCLWLYG